MHHGQARRVRADPEKRRIGERELPKVADHDIEPDGDQAIHEHRVDHELVVIIENQWQQKQYNQQHDGQRTPDRGMISHVPASIRP